MKKKNKISGATLNWNGDIVLCFDSGEILPGKLDRILYPEYYKVRKDYPCDPKTNKPLEIYK